MRKLLQLWDKYAWKGYLALLSFMLGMIAGAFVYERYNKKNTPSSRALQGCELTAATIEYELEGTRNTVDRMAGIIGGYKASLECCLDPIRCLNTTDH